MKFTAMVCISYEGNGISHSKWPFQLARSEIEIINVLDQCVRKECHAYERTTQICKFRMSRYLNYQNTWFRESYRDADVSDARPSMIKLND